MREKDELIKQVNKQIIVAVIPIILNVLLNYGVCNLNLFSVYVPGMYLSIFLMYAIFILMTALTQKTHLATYIIAALIFIISIINNVKLYYAQSPIYLSDLYFLNNLQEVAGIVKNDLFTHIDYVQLAILFIFLIIMCRISKKNTIEIKSIKIRLITPLVTLVILTSIFIPIKVKDEFLLDIIYNIQGRKDYMTVTTGTDYYARYGVLAGIYGMELENRKTPPETYNKEEIKQVLEKADESEQTDRDLQKPNIIIMFQESYWNIENLEEIKFDKNVTENVNKLKEKESSAKLLSATYGGLSSNIEFELLTGGNLAYFGTGYHPFIQLYNKKESGNNPSIIKELKNNGYQTKVVFGRDYYSSQSVYQKLGMDEYVNAYTDKPDYEEKIKGTYLSDEALVDDVIKALNDKSPEDKIFYMVATIQSHMPFLKDKYDNYNISVTESSLSEEETGVILSYAQGVYDTNLQIQRLYDEIQKIQEPTIVIVLGDHLPYLYNSQGEDILQKLSYFNTEDEKQNLLRKYETECIVMSNYNKKIDFESEYISPDMLLTTIINKMDITLSPYYKWLYQASKILPAQNQYINIINNSNIYYQNEILPENVQKMKELRENIQYYLFEEKNK